ncbi:unnamed protein product [Pedinophyceae sp. YPF-701]|nr:unnamed protein product [Pedinophyceae sp. YPF-701]
MSINPFCEIALEEAARMKERGLTEEVVAVSLGPSKCADSLRTAMALGADRAIHVLHEGPDVEPLGVARTLEAICRREKPSLALLGKVAVDGDHSQTGQMLAGLLGWPQATAASQIDLSEPGWATVQREAESGMETLRMKLPAVVTADLRLNQPRYAPLAAIVKARRKPVETLSAGDLGVDLTRQVEVVSASTPPPRPPGVRVRSVEELVDKLVNEAGVLKDQ